MASPASTRIVLSGFADPRTMSGAAAWYDAADVNSMIKTASTNAVSLWADQIYGGSGGKWHTGNVAYYGPRLAGGYASFTALTAFGTGDFSVSAKVKTDSFATMQDAFGGALNSFGLRIISTTGYLRSTKVSVFDNSASTAGVTAGTECVIGYTRTGGVGTYYIDGVSVGTTADVQDYTVGITMIGSTVAGATYCFGGTIRSARVYSTALSAGAMLADAGGTIQANNTFAADFTVQTPGAASFTATTGQTVTINGSALIGWFDASNGLCLNGVANNGAYTADAAAFDILGDIDIRVKVALNDWTPATANVLFAKSNVDPNRSWHLEVVATTGLLNFTWNPLGTVASQIVAYSTVAPTVADFGAIWLRVTLDVDNGAAGNTVTFYTSSDGSTWSQLGNTVVNAGVTTLVNSNANLEIGARQGGATGMMSGIIYRAQVLNGIAGTAVWDVDFSTYPKLAAYVADKSATGAVVTLLQTGDYGARISAPRDAYNFTSTKRPIHVSEAANGCWNYPGAGEQAGITRDCIYSDGSTAVRRTGWTPGTAGAIAGQVVSIPFEFYCPSADPASNMICFQSAPSAIDSTAVANALDIFMGAAGGVFYIQQRGTSAAERRYAAHGTFRTVYSGTWVRGLVVFETADTTTAPKVYVNGVDISGSFSVTTTGSPPNWMPTTLDTTSWVAGFTWGAGFYVPHSPILGALSSAEAIAWTTAGGALPAWATLGQGSAVNAQTSAWVNGGATYNYGTLTSANGATISSAIRTDGVDGVNGSFANGVSIANVAIGKKYRLTYTLTLTSGTAPRILFNNSGLDLGNTSVGTNTVEWTVTSLTSPGIQFRNAFGQSANWSMANILLVECGRIFTPVLQPSLTVADAGTNALSGTITAGQYPILYKPGSYVWFDGVDDSLKTPGFVMAQPESVYMVGRPFSVTNNDYVFDGNAINTMILFQSTPSPRIAINAGGAGYITSDGWLANTAAVVTSIFNAASTYLRINRGTASTSSTTAGTAAANGLTLGAKADGTVAANVGVAAFGAMDGDHDLITQNKIVRWLGRQKGIEV